MSRGLKRGDRIQVRGGNVLLGAYGTVVSDNERTYGKVDVLIDGYQKPRLMDFSRLVLAEDSTPERASAMAELIKTIAPSQVASLPAMIPSAMRANTQWQMEQEAIQRKRTEALKEMRERKDATLRHGRERAREVLVRLKIEYPTQADLDREEASIHEGFDLWKLKNQQRLRVAYWS